MNVPVGKNFGNFTDVKEVQYSFSGCIGFYNNRIRDGNPMDKIIELFADGKTLLLEFNLKNLNWCKLYLNINNTTIPLGANSFDKIIDSLILHFSHTETRKNFTYKDKEMFTIVCLMNPHCVIAGKELNNDGLELNFIDKDGGFLPSILLSKEDISRWTILLKSLESIVSNSK